MKFLPAILSPLIFLIKLIFHLAYKANNVRDTFILILSRKRLVGHYLRSMIEGVPIDLFLCNSTPLHKIWRFSVMHSFRSISAFFLPTYFLTFCLPWRSEYHRRFFYSQTGWPAAEEVIQTRRRVGASSSFYVGQIWTAHTARCQQVAL